MFKNDPMLKINLKKMRETGRCKKFIFYDMPGVGWNLYVFLKKEGGSIDFLKKISKILLHILI